MSPKKKTVKKERKYRITHDPTTGLWYARKIDAPFVWDWRKHSICLGYPKKVAYAEARKRGLI